MHDAACSQTETYGVCYLSCASSLQSMCGRDFAVVSTLYHALPWFVHVSPMPGSIVQALACRL
jgi:hypothetical protein